MAWDMKAVEAPSSAIKIALADIPEDVKIGVEEGYAYCQANPSERVVVTFTGDDKSTGEDKRDLTRAQVRNYCEQRPDGRITASIWSILADPESGESSTEESAAPGLSMRFTKYVKKEKKSG